MDTVCVKQKGYLVKLDFTHFDDFLTNHKCLYALKLSEYVLSLSFYHSRSKMSSEDLKLNDSVFFSLSIVAKNSL